MQKTLIAILLATVTVVPLAHAGSYAWDGYIAPIETGYLLTQTDEFVLTLNAGDVITSTVTWTNPDADIDLRLTAPGGSCSVLPSPDAACLVGSATGRVTGGVPSCSYASNAPFVAAQTSETFTKTAAVSGKFKVDVEAAWINPVTDGGAAYHLEITVNGAAPVVADPVTINYIHSSDLVCHAQLP